MSTALIAIIGLIILILVHELGHFSAAKFFKVKVEEFGLGLPPRFWSKKIGETLYSLNWLPFGGFVKIFGEDPEFDLNSNTTAENSLALDEKSRSFQCQPVWKRAIMLSAGVIANIIIAWFLFAVIFMIGTNPAVIIHTVSEDSPAAAVGLESGDLIVDFSSVDTLTAYLNEHQGESIDLTIKRNGDLKTFSVIPRSDPPANEGALGVALIESGIPQTGFFMSFIESAKFTWQALLMIIGAVIIIFKELLTGTTPDVMGPVGVYSVAAEVGQIGALYVVHLVALISLNLAVLNILPFPALDGGRLLFLLIEKIKGSPIPPKFEAYTNTAGLLLLLSLMVLITISDIMKL